MATTALCDNTSVNNAVNTLQIISKVINTNKGANNINVELNQSINTNVYILSIEGDTDKYLPKKLIVQQ